MKKILLSLATLSLMSGSIQTATAGIGVSLQFGVPSPYYYPPQRVYTTMSVAPAPYVAAAPVAPPAPYYYYAPPAPYYAPAPTVVYSQPIYPAPVVVRPYSPICIATPVIGFRFGFGGYHHYRRW